MEDTKMASTADSAKLYEIIMEAKRITGEKDGKKYNFLAWRTP